LEKLVANTSVLVGLNGNKEQFEITCQAWLNVSIPGGKNFCTENTGKSVIITIVTIRDRSRKRKSQSN
jgi:hypothetical protein